MQVLYRPNNNRQRKKEIRCNNTLTTVGRMRKKLQSRAVVNLAQRIPYRYHIIGTAHCHSYWYWTRHYLVLVTLMIAFGTGIILEYYGTVRVLAALIIDPRQHHLPPLTLLTRCNRMGCHKQSPLRYLKHKHPTKS